MNSLPRPPKGVCNIRPGVPEEGLGVYHEDSDVYNLNLTFKDQSLGCDHEGPQNQECRIEEGGYITWIEDGLRRHIRAEGGYADIVLTNGLGARCVGPICFQSASNLENMNSHSKTNALKLLKKLKKLERAKRFEPSTLTLAR